MQKLKTKNGVKIKESLCILHYSPFAWSLHERGARRHTEKRFEWLVAFTNVELIFIECIIHNPSKFQE